MQDNKSKYTGGHKIYFLIKKLLYLAHFIREIIFLYLSFHGKQHYLIQSHYYLVSVICDHEFFINLLTKRVQLLFKKPNLYPQPAKNIYTPVF